MNPYVICPHNIGIDEIEKSNKGTMGLIKLINISKDFTSTLGKVKSTALFDINLDIREGEIICLLGPSGSGKTTLLRIIAGIEFETAGTIEFNGFPINEVNAQNRQIGFVFQNTDAIYPHLTVFENVSFPLKLKLRKSLNKNITGVVKRILEKVDLNDKENNYPHELSGGEKQRVALARALVYNPKLLLLDEPLSSLDNILKKEILDLIKDLHKEFNTTIIYVTHDEREAIEIGDRIVILSDGRILQQGEVQQILENPENSQVAKIIGGWNVLNGRFLKSEKEEYLKINERDYLWGKTEMLSDKDIEIGFPMSKVEVNKNNETQSNIISIACRINKIIKYQSRTVIEVDVGSQRVKIEKDAQVLNEFQKDETAFLQIDKQFIQIWKQ